MSTRNGNRPKADIARKKKLQRRKKTKELKQQLAAGTTETAQGKQKSK